MSDSLTPSPFPKPPRSNLPVTQNSSERAETLAAIREGLADVAAGRTKPAREVIEELAKKYNL